MEHVLKKIWENTNQLTDVEKKHIEKCDLCKKEYQLAKKIEMSIETLPEFSIPLDIEAIVTRVLLKPVYKIWQLILVGIFVISLPFILQMDIFTIFLDQKQLFFITIFSISIYMLLMIAFTFQIFINYYGKIEPFSEKIDIFLEKKLMKLEK
ncbi:MAG: hypothetical protein KatS3mg129_3173 [Leptospiraceae bacterium]|nr:MAG: hypothetical protein KatS3mg129_3173 [Leptospiraceae bacterium]